MAAEQRVEKKTQLENIHTIIEQSVPADRLAEVRRILYGPPVSELPLAAEASALSKEHKFEIRAFKMSASQPEAFRPPRIVRVAGIQNMMAESTSAPIKDQMEALHKKIERMIDAAGAMKVNVVCMQEAWPQPFFFCTREKRPWMDFAQSAEDGPTVKLCQRLSLKHNMVILCPLLERDGAHQGIIWNTVVVIGNAGNVIGKHRKFHIPRVGAFTESDYYLEGNTGHPVFETAFGKIGIAICYGRHFAQNWRAFAMNGAEIVFNPAATTDGLSESLWSIEARAAAIFNNYFTVCINRVGTETYPREFTTGDGKPASKSFGHFYGSSYVNGPDSQRTPPLSRTRDGLIIADCDLNLIMQIRDTWMLQACARDELYLQELKSYCGPDFKPQVIRDPGLDQKQ